MPRKDKHQIQGVVALRMEDSQREGVRASVVSLVFFFFNVEANVK